MICISIYTSSLFEPKAKSHHQPANKKPNSSLTHNLTVKNSYLPRSSDKVHQGQKRTSLGEYYFKLWKMMIRAEKNNSKK